MDTTLTRDDDASRYELRQGSTLLAALDYQDNGTAVSLTRAFTVPTFRGQGHAATLTEVVQEMLLTTTSERQGRAIDFDSSGSMEKKKQEGYF